MISFVMFLVWLAALVIVVATALPLTRSVRWWVRAWEFPRLHIAICALVVLFLIFALPMAFKDLLIVTIAACMIYQLMRVFPYTRLAPTEIPISAGVPEDSKLKLFSANVLMENSRKGDLINIIEREDPDVLFLMEINQSWLDALEDILDRYPTVVTYPQDNYYGLVFATRLTAPSADVVFLSDDNTPTLRAELLGPDGTGFNFVGLHPRPPVPGNTTAERDEQIKKAAVFTGNADWPTVCMGDFNDVAWSWTSRRFKQYGSYLEPRVGRGMFSTFHAQYPLLSVPIDQLYLTDGVGLVSFGRLEEFGSDHFPIHAVITFHEIQTNS
ncbi:endonuclease/exonuclease/phosphatase family protein [Sulfitobacter sp. JB4-11]|uniref:endonuclease/exonuclease/phosphatase family protein n=1 Tax=Sulfitobacter rhodophyticola TaxID=3238304 RepID=UPI003D813FF3